MNVSDWSPSHITLLEAGEIHKFMRLMDLASCFRLGGTFEDFCKAQALSTESEGIEVYAQKPVNLDSQPGFFPIEETRGRVEFQSEGLQYQNLFDFFYFHPPKRMRRNRHRRVREGERSTPCHLTLQ